MKNYFKKAVCNLSLPRSQTVREYEIKRMPLGAYMAAMQRLKNFPQEAMEAIFPGMDIDAVIKQLTKIDTDMLGQIVTRAFAALPGYVAELLAELTGIPEERLVNDPAIGADGLMEIIDAWLEVNGIENFIKAVRELIAKTKAQAANSGSKS